MINMNLFSHEAALIERMRSGATEGTAQADKPSDTMILGRTESPNESAKRAVTCNFTYHPPTPAMLPKFELLRNRGKELGLLIIELVPDGKERNKALSNLEMAVMQCNAGIARRG